MGLWRGSEKRAWTRRATRGTWICGNLAASLTQDSGWDWRELYPGSASLNIFGTRLLFPVSSTESIPKETIQGVKDFSCFDIPRGGREIVSLKRKDNKPRGILQRAVLCRGKFLFSKFWEGSICLLKRFWARSSLLRAEQPSW